MKNTHEIVLSFCYEPFKNKRRPRLSAAPETRKIKFKHRGADLDL